MDRRSFLSRSSLALGATIALPSLPALANESRTPFMPGSWEEIRSQFPLDPAKIHMSQMLFASHPKWVSDAIEKHRKAFDFNAVEYVEENLMKLEKVARQSAATYLQADPEEIVMTDSTTMGLAILYNGLRLKPGDEILTTTHDHYATEKSLEYAVMKNNAVIKRVSLYQNPAQVSVDENQSFCWPRSSSSCNAPMAKLKVAKPNTSKRCSCEPGTGRMYLHTP